MLTPAGSSGAGAGWTPGRSRTSWPTARKQATSVLMAPTPACDPATARAKAEARGYGRGAARAFAGFLNPRGSPDAGRLDGVEGPRGAVREPVEATIAPIDEAVAHVADGSPTKLDELRKRAEQRGYGRGAALAFAGLLSPASPALLKTPGAERSWAALDEAARSLADDAFAAAVEPAETPPAVREAPAPPPSEVRWYDDRAPSPVRQERRDAGATERFRRKAAKAKENGEDAQREARQREGELNRERARVYAAEQRVKQRLETIRRQERAVEAHEAARSGAARRAFRAWRRALETPSPVEASGYGEGAARAFAGLLDARKRDAVAPVSKRSELADVRRRLRDRAPRADSRSPRAAVEPAPPPPQPRGRRRAPPPPAVAAARVPTPPLPPPAPPPPPRRPTLLTPEGPGLRKGSSGIFAEDPLVGLSPPEAPPQYPLTQKVAQELKAIIFPVPEHLRADPAPAPAPAAAPADMSAYDDDDDDDDAPAPASAPEAADMTAYDDDGSEAPTLTRDDGAAADMGAYEDDGSEAPAADPSAPEDDGAAAADLSLYADDASDDADDWPVRSASPAVERPATAGVSVSLEDEPSPPFATPREPYEPAAFARAAVDLSTPLKPPSIYERARGAARAPAVAETSPRPPLTGKRATLSPGNVDELDFRPDKAVAAAPAAAPPEASDAFAVPPTPHNSRSDLADDEATDPGVRSDPADDAVAAAAAAPHDVEPAPVAEAIVRAAPPPTRATEPSDPAADAVAAEADATVEEAAAPGPTLGLGAVARLGTAAARVRRMRRRKPSEACGVLAEVGAGTRSAARRPSRPPRRRRGRRRRRSPTGACGRASARAPSSTRSSRRTSCPARPRRSPRSAPRTNRRRARRRPPSRAPSGARATPSARRCSATSGAARRRRPPRPRCSLVGRRRPPRNWSSRARAASWRRRSTWRRRRPSCRRRRGRRPRRRPRS